MGEGVFEDDGDVGQIEVVPGVVGEGARVVDCKLLDYVVGMLNGECTDEFLS